MRRLLTIVVRLRGSQSVNLQLLIGIALLYGFFAVFYTSEWLARGNTENLARQGAVLLVISLAQMFALLIGGFDISVGANMGFTSVVTALMMTRHGTSIAFAIVIGLAVATLIGFVNGFLISALGVSPFAATLGMLSFLIGFGKRVAADNPSPGPGRVRIGGWLGLGPSAVGPGNRHDLYRPVLGRPAKASPRPLHLRDRGSRNTSRLAGVPTVWYEIVAYSLCGFLAGIAGIMLASRLAVGQTELGSGYELLSIATAVIGGTAMGEGSGR